MSQEINAFKNQARRLHKHLKATIPDFSYSQSLEATAALHGAANWRTLVGQEQVDSPAAAPAAIASSAVPEARYIVIDGMFLETDGRRLPSRYVFDKTEERVVLMQIQAANGDWAKADRSQVERVDVCLFPDFEFDSRTEVNALPAWASQVDKNASYTQSHGDMPFEAGPPEGVFGFGPPMSKAEKFLMGEHEYQYVVFWYFKHPDSGFPSAVRFVFDCCANRVVALQVEAGPKKWVDAGAAQIAKFDTTFKASHIAVLHDEEFMGREDAVCPPEWATLVEDAKKPSSRFLVSEGWGHIFGPGMPDTTVRFVYDQKEEAIIFMEILGSMSRWFVANHAQTADVEDSLKNANEEALESPDDWDLEETDELPGWAMKQVDNAMSTERRYVSGPWEHEFFPGMPADKCRFVFDRREGRIIRLELKGSDGWIDGGDTFASILEDAIRSESIEVFECPKDHGYEDIEESDSLPVWATR